MSKTQTIQWTESDEVRNRLRGLVIYRTLFDAIWPGAFEHPVVVKSLREVAEWVETASDSEIFERGAPLHNSLMELVDKAKDMLPPKCSDSQILADFQYCQTQGELTWDRGIQFKWLHKWFDTSRLPIPRDFPLHGRIGVGRHSGTSAVEEAQLFRDSFQLRAKVHQLWGGLEECMRRDNRHNGAFIYREHASLLNMNLCCFARLAVFSYYSFVECFVNSVANDFLLRNPKLAAAKQELLRGTKKGSYLGIEYKLEKYPGVIRGDDRTTYVLSDPKQLREPFITFVGILKDLRGSTAHFAANKTPIWLKPQEWIDHIDAASVTCLEVSKKYWEACYPGRSYPDYLFEFNANRVEEVVKEALAKEVDARDLLDRCELPKGARLP